MATNNGNRKFTKRSNNWMIVAFLIVAAGYIALEIIGTERPDQKADKTMIELDISGIYEIDFKMTSGFYRITKDITETWKLDDSISINQEFVENYIAQFENISNNNYVELTAVSSLPSSEIDTLIIKSADEPVDVEIKCYKMNDKDYKYLLQSNQNSDLFFKSDVEGLRQQLFLRPEQFKR